METIVSSICSSIVPLFTNTIIKHVVYPFTTTRNVRALESAVRELVAKKEDVETTITNAERESGVPTAQVNSWMEEIKAAEKKASEIQQNYLQQSRCLWNISPNIWSNYKISRSAAKEQLEVKNLCDKKPPTEEIIVHMPPPLAQEIPVDSASSSKSSNLQSTLDHIKDDAHSIIGILGMGGVGKTHLLKQIIKELCGDGTFAPVVFVTCSKECSEEKVQKEIIKKLGLPESDSAEQRGNTIFNFLKKKNFLLLLDDLWNRVDLLSVGVPDLKDSADTFKRKVVLTTRSTEVCGRMDVNKKIRMDALKWDDAWSLFKERVTEETINSHPSIQRLAIEVAQELAGLPLALITVGRAMSDSTHPYEWELAVERLKQARLPEVKFGDNDESVFLTLKFSYDSLQTETLKQCFLHCSLWPEDHLIHKKQLIEMWMGLGLIDELVKNEVNVTDKKEMNEIDKVGYNCIRRLEAKCLLESVDGDDHVVKMHDVIRDMAIWIVNNKGDERHKWIVQAGMKKKSVEIPVPPHTEIISLVNMRAEVSLSTTCSSTKLFALLLGDNEICDMKPLQLTLFSNLTFLDLLRNYSIVALPVEICKLIHLQFLNLSCARRLKVLPKEFEALINLKYLLMRDTDCAIPIGVISKLKALRVLDLFGNCINYNGIIETDLKSFTSLEEELKGLPHFQALGITLCNFHDFQKLSQSSIIPVRWLDIRQVESEDCLTFSSHFLENPMLQNNLVSLDLSQMSVNWVKFERGSHEQCIYHLGRLEELKFVAVNMKQFVWTGLYPKDVFSGLQILYFSYCSQLTSISWAACLPCIRELIVRCCGRMKYLVSMDELNKGELLICHPPFAFLKKLYLFLNDELESVSDGMITFPVLERVEVTLCGKLKKLPFNTGNPPKRLDLVGSDNWWNNIEMDDENHRSVLVPFFRNVFGN